MSGRMKDRVKAKAGFDACTDTPRVLYAVEVLERGRIGAARWVPMTDANTGRIFMYEAMGAADSRRALVVKTGKRARVVVYRQVSVREGGEA